MVKNEPDGSLSSEILVRRARTSLLLEHPFFGSLILRLNLKIDPKCQDLWTNGQTLGFNPAWVAVTSKKALEAALAHEMLHLALGHHVRRKGRDRKLWNMACDYAVNLLLKDAGFSLPKNYLYNESLANLSADAIFNLLPQLLDQPPHGGAKKEAQTGLTSAAKPQGTAQGAFKKDQKTGQASNVYGRQKDLATDNLANLAKEGEKNPGQDKAMYFGEVRDHPALDGSSESKGEEKAQADAKIALHMAMSRAFHQGDMPGHFQRLLKNKIAPSMDWQDLLQRFLEQCVQNDSTWTHPNRRYIHQELYLPARSEPAIPCICLAIDTSGSIDEDLLGRFCAELSAILATYETNLTVLTHDSQIQDVLTFTRADLPITIIPKGGGGTDFRPVCAKIEDEGLHPICLLWFTDLECSSYPPEPNYPVLWITTSSNQPPFGEVLTLAAYQ